jgi:hypothetical protein
MADLIFLLDRRVMEILIAIQKIDLNVIVT